MSQDTRVNQKVKSVSRGTLKTNLVEFNYLQAEIIIIDPKPYQSTHCFICHWELTDGFFQGKPNIDKCFRIRSSAEVRNDMESAWIIVEGSSSRKLDFPNICNLFHRFSKLINITIICSPMLLIHFFWYFGKRRRFLPPGAYAFLTSSVHVPLKTVFNQIW